MSSSRSASRRVLCAVPRCAILFAASILAVGCAGARVVSRHAYENAEKGAATLYGKAEDYAKKSLELTTKAVTDIRSDSTPGVASLLQQDDPAHWTPQMFVDKVGQDPALGSSTSAVSASKQVASLLEAQRQVSESAAELDAAEAAGDVVFSRGLSFCVQPLVALRGPMHTTTIGALGVNWRFLPDGSDPVALQFVLGGALNPSSAGSDVGAAVGVGLSHPVGASGAISVGFVHWSEGADTRNGVYIGITLGDFGRTPGGSH